MSTNEDTRPVEFSLSRECPNCGTERNGLHASENLAACPYWVPTIGWVDSNTLFRVREFLGVE